MLFTVRSYHPLAYMLILTWQFKEPWFGTPVNSLSPGDMVEWILAGLKLIDRRWAQTFLRSTIRCVDSADIIDVRFRYIHTKKVPTWISGTRNGSSLSLSCQLQLLQCSGLAQLNEHLWEVRVRCEDADSSPALSTYHIWVWDQAPPNGHRCVRNANYTSGIVDSRHGR